jgi:hypothetical protein
MSNEKQTDSLNWKNKLEDPDGLPEESIMDKNAAWEKLHNRLHEKPRLNKMAWYWVAAACLLLALIVSWGIINKKDNDLVKITPQQKQNKTTPVPVLTVIKKEQVAILSSLSIEKNQPVKNIFDKRNLKNSNATNKKNNTKKGEPLIAYTNTVIDKTPEPLINNLSPANNTATIKPIAIAKPTLRVVHINELETAPAIGPEQVAVSVHHEQNNFKFRFRDIHPVNQPAAPRQEYATLKIPLTN